MMAKVADPVLLARPVKSVGKGAMPKITAVFLAFAMVALLFVWSPSVAQAVESEQAESAEAVLAVEEPEEGLLVPETPKEDSFVPEASTEDSFGPEASIDNIDALEQVEGPLTSGTYAIQSTLPGGRVLDIAGGSREPGARLQLFDSNDTLAQRFTITVLEDGFCMITNVNSGLALEVADANTANGIPIRQALLRETPAQQWAVVQNADGSYRFESCLNRNFVLDVANGSGANGAKLQLFENNGTASQKFKVFKEAKDPVAPGAVIEEGVYRISCAANPGLVLDVSGASMADGTAVQVYKANGTTAQMFLIEPDGEGFYTIKAVHSGKAVESTRGTIVPGTAIRQFAPSSQDAQRWSLQPQGNGGYALVCKANGLVLGVASNNLAQGSKALAMVASETDAQTWLLEKVDSLIADGVYQIRANLGSKRTLDIPGASTASGVKPQLYKVNQTQAQKFQITNNDDGTVSIESLCSGLRLTRQGSAIVQEAKNESQAQRWLVVPSRCGGFSILSAEDPTLAMDVQWAKDADGTPVGLYAINGSQAQSFVPEHCSVVGNGVYIIGSAASSRVLDVASGSLADRANIQIYDRNNTGAQKWKIVENAGWYTITNVRSGRVLDVQNALAQSGANVQQFSPNGSPAQRWSIEYAGGGRYRFVSALGNLVLTVGGDGVSNVSNVEVATPSDAPTQQFTLTPTTYQATLAELYNSLNSAPSGDGVSNFGGGSGISAAHANAIQGALNRIRLAGFRVGFVAMDLTTGYGFSSNATGYNYAASSIKGPYVASVCKYLPNEIGPWRYTMTETIEVSSNEGYAALRNRFGSWPMACLMNEAGVSSFSSDTRYPYYTPKDLAKLLVACNNYFFSGAPNADWCRNLYTHTYHSPIYYQLSKPGTVTYSKPGWYPNTGSLGAFNDAGIVVHGDHTYVVAILTSAYERYDLLNPLVNSIDAATGDLR